MSLEEPARPDCHSRGCRAGQQVCGGLAFVPRVNLVSGGKQRQPLQLRSLTNLYIRVAKKKKIFEKSSFQSTKEVKLGDASYKCWVSNRCLPHHWME